jgi:hypothetical protein
MLKIEIDGLADAERAIGHMLGNITYMERTGIGQVLGDWQRETVNRVPFVRRYRAAGRADTLFRPHSLRQVRRSRRYQRRGQRAILRLAAKPSLKAARAVGRLQELQSTLPILRPELVEELSRQLLEMAVEKLTWSE